MKNVIVITGGAGFVGSNLIKLFLKKTKYRIISIDNYSTGSKKNQIKNQVNRRLSLPRIIDLKHLRLLKKIIKKITK